MLRLISAAFHLSVLAALIRVLLTLIRNLRILKRLEDEPPPRADNQPSISVLIPARNEADSLPKCLDSLRLQAYPDYTVTVLDDESMDQTGSVVRAIVDRDDRFILIHGKPLPDGWIGKPWACQQLAEQATGELLLFVDADIWFEPDVLARTAGVMQRERPGLFSAMPGQETGTFVERLVIPGLYMIFLCNYSLWLLQDPARLDVSAANGQFICMTAEYYAQLGGHRSVRDKLVEDIALARATKADARRVVARTAINSVHCRMYRSSREVIDGFSKNAFASFGESPGQALAAIAVMAATHIIPPVLLVRGIRRGSRMTGVAAAEVGLGLALRWIVSGRTGFRRGDVWMAHLNAVAFVGITLRSMWWRYAGRGYRWKGRSYRSAGGQG